MSEPRAHRPSPPPDHPRARENVLAETDSGGSTVARYTLGPELYGALVSQRRSGATSFHHGVHPERSRRDALGSTRQLSDASQAVTDSRDYRAFGATNASSGSNPNRFWWNGKWGYYSQSDPGNYWLRARVYEDDNARFLSRDPAQEEINLYRYVGNRPLLLVDPSGRQGCRPG
jgi:RHS repeat-associated protein